ncbi:hypothetical protein GCM10027447_16760 [Glycomyces halotolerans]
MAKKDWFKSKERDFMVRGLAEAKRNGDRRLAKAFEADLKNEDRAARRNKRKNGGYRSRPEWLDKSAFNDSH